MQKIFVLLSGIVIPAEYAFEKQIPILKKYGEVVCIEYNSQEFSEELVFTHLQEIIEKAQKEDKEVVLGGLSFGSACIIHFLLQADPTLLQQVKQVIFFGSVLSTDHLRRRAVGLFVSPLRKIWGKQFVLHFTAASMKRIFRGDPQSSYRKEIRHTLKQTSPKALRQRMQFILKKHHLDMQEFKKLSAIQALFIWWDMDFVHEKDRRELESVFDTETSVSISGRHGWLVSEAWQVNPVLEAFLQEANG